MKFPGDYKMKYFELLLKEEKHRKEISSLHDVIALLFFLGYCYHKGLEIGSCPIKIPRSKTFSREIQEKL